MMQEHDDGAAARKRLPRLALGGAETHHTSTGTHHGSVPHPHEIGLIVETASSQVSASSTATANGDAVLFRRAHSGGAAPSTNDVPMFASPLGHRKLQDHESLLKLPQELLAASVTNKNSKKMDMASNADTTDTLSDVNIDQEDNDSNSNDGLSQLERLRRWVHSVRQTFGTSFLLLVCAVYASQGFNSFSALAINYFFKDHLKLQPAESQALMTVLMFPWGIKPVYGIISDSLPLFRYHRKSYMILFSSLGATAYLILSVPDLVTTTFGAVSVLTLNSLSASVIDVVIDARVVEMSRLDPKNGANDLQSVSWTAMAVGGIVGAVLSGPATDYLGVRGVFFFASIGPLVVLGFALVMHENKSRVSARRFVSSAKRQFFQLKGAVMTPVIWKCALWVFLSGAVSPGYSQVFFYFSTDVLKFTPEFLGTVSAFGFLFLLIGTLIYNAFFKDVSFRRIFLIAQLSLATVSLLDVILVTRTNLRLGIPDKAFVLGDAVIADVVSRLKTMPVLVLCAKLCPKGIEGTLFALLMSISNFSFSVSEFWGAFICHSLGIQKDAYDDLWIAIVFRSILKLTPILFLFLIPTSDPQDIVDRIHFQSGNGSDGSGSGGGRRLDDDDDDDAQDLEDDDDDGSPNGVIRKDHTVNSSPGVTPAPRASRREIDVDVV